MNTRILFLDDSGKPDAKHASHSVVMAGFSIPSQAVPALSRRVLGAKTHFFPGRGQPSSWEIKAADVIKPNPWKRRKNRDFALELVRIVSSLGGSVYSVTLDKNRMHHVMSLSQTMPLQLQALIEHFHVECRHHGETGMLVADWSSQHADQHASRCVASFVASRRLEIHPSVYYASSHATQAIQVADLISGGCRRIAQGNGGLSLLDDVFSNACTVAPMLGLRTIKGRLYSNRIQLF